MFDESFASMLANMPEMAPLSAERERALILRWQSVRDEAAGREVTLAFRPLLARMAAAKNRRHRTSSLSDLFQEANVGLADALNTFDFRDGIRFATHLLWQAKRRVGESILPAKSVVAIPHGSENLSFVSRGRWMEESLRKKMPNTDVDPELARIFGLSIGRMRSLRAASSGDISIDALVSNGGRDGDDVRTVGDGLRDESDHGELVADTIDLDRRRRFVAEAISEVLDDREKHIIDVRCLREVATTHEEIAAEYGISRARVQQLEARAIAKLTNHIKARMEPVLATA